MPETLPNLRDVGGLAAGPGHQVTRGRLLRSAVPRADDLVPSEIAWPPALVVDLRSAPEQESEHPLAGQVPRQLNVSLLAALRPERGWATDLPDLYERLLDDAPHLLVEVVQQVADAEGPVLVHCAAGKDRTGIVVALVLRLLGVSRDDVVRDYLQTDAARTEIDRRLRRDERHGDLPATFYETPVDAILRVLDRWDRAEGGVQGWFLDAGGSAATLDRLRASMLEAGSSPVGPSPSAEVQSEAASAESASPSSR